MQWNGRCRLHFIHLPFHKPAAFLICPIGPELGSKTLSPNARLLLRGYNNPWERFCWLTTVKGHCSPRIKLDQPEAVVEGGAHHQQPSREDVLQTQLPWGGSQARSCLPVSQLLCQLHHAPCRQAWFCAALTLPGMGMGWVGQEGDTSRPRAVIT